MDYKELVNLAADARKKSISPYSNFKVGAALLTEDGKVYEGANIENATYGLTICAERTALFAALLAGERKFKAISVIGDDGGFCPPCGPCRQLLVEFCGPELDVILRKSEGDLQIIKMKELLPLSFDGTFLK
ncbi:MAG: cytidine deaminase [bacterium]